MCMPAGPSMPMPAPIVAPPAPALPPPPAQTIATTNPAIPNTSVKKVASRRNPLAIQKSDSVATGLNIPV